MVGLEPCPKKNITGILSPQKKKKITTLIPPPPKQSTLQLSYTPPSSSISFSTVVMPTSQGMGLSWWRSRRGDQLMSSIVPACAQICLLCVFLLLGLACVFALLSSFFVFISFSPVAGCFTLHRPLCILYIFLNAVCLVHLSRHDD